METRTGIFLRRTLVSCIALSLGQMYVIGAASQSAHAQTASTAKRGVAVEQEVIITATKRKTSLQSTPIAITAISGASLEKQGLTNLEQVAHSVPGIAIKSSGPGQTEFEMRGLSSAGGSSPTVGFYLDDTAITPPAAAQAGKVVIDPNLYDLQDVEVLRGPQGTLYGAGSMGGTIRVVTNKPDPTGFHASAQTILSGTDGGGFNHGENVMVNVPLVPDTLALRVVGSEAYTSGWISRNVVGNFPVAQGNGLTRGNVGSAPLISSQAGVNDEELLGTRVALRYTPNDDLTVTPFLFFQQIHSNGMSTVDSNPGTAAHYQPFNVAEPYDDRFATYGVTGDYKFNAFDVTSSTAYWSRNSTTTQDASEPLQYSLGLPSVYTSQGGIGPSSITEYDLTHQISEELRITSRNNSVLQWIVGAYYSDFTSDYNLTSIIPGAAPIFGTNNLIRQVQPTTITQYAGFGEATYAITSKLKANVGLRYYSYSTTVNTAVSGIVSQSGTNATTYTSAGESNSGINPKFNLSYTFDNDHMIYATIAKGFRPGGGNQPVPANPATTEGASCLAALQALGKNSAPGSYGPDSVWSYEAGEKARLFGMLTVDGAVYYENWTGVQQVIPLSCGFPYTDNAGNAAVYGAELEVHANLANGLVWSGSGDYTDAYLTQTTAGTGEQKGAPLQDISPWTASTSLDYSFPVKDMEGSTSIDYEFQGTRTDATYYPMNHLPAYSLVNLRGGLSEDAWTVSVFVDNLTNTRSLITDTTSLSVNLPTFNRIAMGQPLTIGMQLDYKFR